MLLSFFDAWPRRVLGVVSLVCVGLLGFGMYLQHVVGLEPCPMCIVQRYALVIVAVLTAVFAVVGRGRAGLLAGAVLALVFAAGGAFTAARQSWLQWYPPESASCGRDIYGMIETFPLQRAIPMIFRGSGDCSKVDWTFLGGSIANWSFVWFCLVFVILLALAFRQLRRR